MGRRVACARARGLADTSHAISLGLALIPITLPDFLVIEATALSFLTLFGLCLHSSDPLCMLGIYLHNLVIIHLHCQLVRRVCINASFHGQLTAIHLYPHAYAGHE